MPLSRPADLIHCVWLDATRAIGPHVHHHDVGRAALTQMEQQLNGPQCDEALAVIRDVAPLADELAAVFRAHDSARLRDMMRNRHAGDLAALSSLPLLMRRLGFDPAASSAPFVATLVDVTGLAVVVLHGTQLSQPVVCLAFHGTGSDRMS